MDKVELRLPITAMFETVDDSIPITGQTRVPVKRIEMEDDGSYTVVVDHWCEPRCEPRVPAETFIESKTNLNDLTDWISKNYKRLSLPNSYLAKDEALNELGVIVGSMSKSEEGVRLHRIADIIEQVDKRASFGDVVTPTLEEMTQKEISEIYALATNDKRFLVP